ncbi:MAG: hypothetical protein U9R75_02965, partial [Candidatus Thermoplasmatota archaeon]|nr:hypothetical protein [Candidatus Thermoplasmatota archaeon]
MKRTMIYKDDHGKEAFAYLAVMLMVLSTLFISYQVYLQKEDEKRGSKTAKITMISSFMEEDRTMVRMELFSLHDQLLIDCETEIVKEITTTSVDGNLETKLSALMEMELEKILNGSRTKREGYTISILNCSADTTPISIDLDGPVPSTGHDNTSGLVDRTMKPSCTGVNTTFNIVLKINDDAGTIEMIERMEFTRETLTLLPMLEGRMERFEMGIESTELPELFNYIVGSLAQMKCLMGYGRVAYGTITPLISEGEIISCADLALALMASSHLHGEDSEFLGGIDEGLGSAPGAGGKRLDMGDLFRNHSGQLDPSMAVIMGEGLFSEGNAPGLDMMLRPLLGTLVDGILLRMIDYMGMGDWFYTMAGGLAQVFEIGSEIVNSVTKSLLGIELLESNDRSAEDILEEVISSSGIFPNDDAFIMNREVQGVTWNDLPVVHYPMIQVPNLTRSSELYLYEDDPSNEFYIGKDGKAHSRAEYYDPEEELLGWNCTVHTLDIDFNFHEMEPAFNGIPLDDEEVFRSLALYLGTIATDDDSAEDIMMEKGKMAVRNGVEMAVDLISAPGSGIWERSWKGWNMSTMPDIEGEELPISEMVSFQLDPMKAIVDVLSGSILENLDLVGFLSFLEDTGASYRTATASFLHDRYDSISGKSDQILSCMDNITETILPNSSWTLTDHSILEENVIIKDHCIAVADPSSLDVLDTYPEIPQSLCLGIYENGIEDPELYTIWTEGIGSSYDETFRRELGKGGDGSDPGFMWEAFTSPDARGGGKSIISADLNLGNLSSMINELMVTALYAVEQMFYLPLNTTSGRFLCSLPDEKNVFRTPGSDIREIEIDLS